MNHFTPEILVESHLFDSTGEKIGRIKDVYLDDATQEPTFVTVDPGLLSATHAVPVSYLTEEKDGYAVPFTKDFLKESPKVVDDHLSPAEEEEVYSYYRGHEVAQSEVTHSEEANAVSAVHSEEVLTDDEAREPLNESSLVEASSPASPVMASEPEDRDGLDSHMKNTVMEEQPMTEDGLAESSDAVTLHEERVEVGTESREVETVRLVKNVVTEEQTVIVPVTHEEVIIEREPIRDGEAASDSISELKEGEEVVVTLHEEVPVLEKETVAVERVSLGADAVTEQVEVPVEVAKEEVSIERSSVEDAFHDGDSSHVAIHDGEVRGEEVVHNDSNLHSGEESERHESFIEKAKDKVEEVAHKVEEKVEGDHHDNRAL